MILDDNYAMLVMFVIVKSRDATQTMAGLSRGIEENVNANNVMFV